MEEILKDYGLKWIASDPQPKLSCHDKEQMTDEEEKHHKLVMQRHSMKE
jgi:hypothetical protein